MAKVCKSIFLIQLAFCAIKSLKTGCESHAKNPVSFPAVIKAKFMLCVIKIIIILLLLYSLKKKKNNNNNKSPCRALKKKSKNLSETSSHKMLNCGEKGILIDSCISVFYYLSDYSIIFHPQKILFCLRSYLYQKLRRNWTFAVFVSFAVVYKC